MKRIITILFIPAVICFTSCATGSAAVDYNDAIVNEQLKIVSKMMSFSSAVLKDSFDQAEEYRQAALKQTQESYKTVEKLGPYHGDTTLLSAALQLFSHYEWALASGYKDILDIVKKDKITEEDQARYAELQASLNAREQELGKKLKEVQAAFAKANNMKMEENKEDNK